MKKSNLNKYGDVTTIIPNRNREKDLLEAIQSIMEQEVKPKEIILVDNGSTDDSVVSVRKMFPKIKIMEMHCSTGVVGFNKGAKEAKTKYIMFADSDCTFPKDWIKKVLEKFEHEPETTAAITLKFIEPEMPKWYLEHPDINTPAYTYTFMGGGVVIKKEAFEKAGRYDEKFFLYVNERELAARWINMGYRILYYPKVHFFHKKPFSIREGEVSLYYHIRNYTWYVVKYFPSKEVLRLFFHVLKNLSFGTIFKHKIGEKGTQGIDKLKRYVSRTKNREKILIKAFIAAFFGLPHYLKQRQPCQKEDFLKGLPYGYKGRKRYY